MPLTLADLLREHWRSYASANRSRLGTSHYRAVRRVLACRTPELGGQLYQCGDCRKHHFAYHSCNHRNCPQCGALDQQLWSAKQEARLLPVPYFMVTFTIPAELRPLCLAFPKTLYDVLLRESAGALSDVIATKHKGGTSGFTSVLHTWGRQMQHHPHVHCIVPAIALSSAGDKFIRPDKDTFLVHFRPLAARFRNRFQTALKEQHPEIFEALTPQQHRVLQPQKQWNVQLQHAGKGVTALRYLARYVHRSAFSPKRLLGYDKQGRVRLRWTCSTSGKTSVMFLTPHEFIRRWLIHVLPKGFTRLRHYGFLSSAAHKTRSRIRLLLGAGPEPVVSPPEREPFSCSDCGGLLHYLGELERLPMPRGPPVISPDAMLA